jgi:hypothetical protein
MLRHTLLQSFGDTDGDFSDFVGNVYQDCPNLFAPLLTRFELPDENLPATPLVSTDLHRAPKGLKRLERAEVKRLQQPTHTPASPSTGTEPSPWLSNLRECLEKGYGKKAMDLGKCPLSYYGQFSFTDA